MSVQPLLTLDETAAVLKVSRATAWRRCKSGALRCVRDGRILRVPEDAIRDYIAAKSVGGEPAAPVEKPSRHPKYGH